VRCSKRETRICKQSLHSNLTHLACFDEIHKSRINVFGNYFQLYKLEDIRVVISKYLIRVPQLYLKCGYQDDDDDDEPWLIENNLD